MEFIIPLVTLATALVAVFWDTTRDDKQGLARVKPAGWVLIFFAMLSCGASMILLDEKRQEQEREREQESSEAMELAMVRNQFLLRCTSDTEFLLNLVCNLAKKHGWRPRKRASLAKSEAKALAHALTTGPYLKRKIEWRIWLLQDPNLAAALRKLSKKEKKQIRDLAQSTREGLEKLQMLNESKVNNKLNNAAGCLKSMTLTISVPLLLSKKTADHAIADMRRKLREFADIIEDQFDESAQMASALKDHPELLAFWQKLQKQRADR